MWDRVLTKGAGRSLIHPAGYPEIMFYALDLRERHGVILGPVRSNRHRSDVRVGAGEPRGLLHVPRIASVQKDETGVIVKIDERDVQDPRLERRGDGGPSHDRVPPPR